MFKGATFLYLIHVGWIEQNKKTTNSSSLQYIAGEKKKSIFCQRLSFLTSNKANGVSSYDFPIHVYSQHAARILKDTDCSDNVTHHEMSVPCADELLCLLHDVYRTAAKT